MRLDREIPRRGHEDVLCPSGILTNREQRIFDIMRSGKEEKKNDAHYGRRTPEQRPERQ